ncbi:hypothetical protein H8356DRAFT_1722832 [Neocallimastix lanati (nom. inval.)]|nr:hypothetical protein H8356DRAFT_1722832 [Neocallimastix sp. JGI-2020a]
MTKLEKSIITCSSSKTSTNTANVAKTTNATNTSSTTMNDIPVEIEPPNIQTNAIKIISYSKYFKIEMKTLHKLYSNLKLFLDTD